MNTRKKKLLSLLLACGIKTFKAIVVSYETFDGQSWSNPLFADWCKLYEGVKLQ